MEKLTSDLGSKLEDIIDANPTHTTALVDNDKVEVKNEKELSYFDMFVNSVTNTSQESIKPLSLDMSSASLSEDVMSAPSWEEMEYQQADAERRDDALLVERLVSYGTKVAHCMEGAKQEVVMRS